MTKKRYWLYAPGKQAENWEEFYQKEIFGLSWDHLRDLRSYPTMEAIAAHLRELEKTTSSKRNDASANFEFLHKMQIGDIIFVKKGLHEILGFGEVTSDYFWDESRDNHRHLRRIKWKMKGNWKVDFTLPLKTLTEITDKPAKVNQGMLYWEELLEKMEC